MRPRIRLAVEQGMGAGPFLAARLYEMQERIARAARLRAASQVMRRIEQRVRLALLPSSVDQIVSQRIDARGSHIRVRAQVKCGVEQLTRRSPILYGLNPTQHRSKL